MRTEFEIKESLAEMERMTEQADRMRNDPGVQKEPILHREFEKWYQRSSARASILKWVLELPYLD